jgi:hypothetical protein
MWAKITHRTRSVWVAFVAALLGGFVFGALAKLADESTIPGASDIGTYFGLWITLVTVIAAWSHSWIAAVVRAVTFLVAMVVSYYVSTLLLFGFFPMRLILAWAALTFILAPPFAALTWHSRGAGWISALATALPVGLLLYEAFSFRWVLPLHAAQFVFDILSAMVLLLILPRDSAQRLRVLALTPAIMLGARVVIEYAWAVITRISRI